jgi:hypothetical protein
MIPDGYRVEETDEKVDALGRRFFRWRAEALKNEHPPLIQSYHYRIEKVPNVPFLYEVVAYQNRLVKV